MNRLMEKTVLAGFVTAWPWAPGPRSRSPFFANATIDGVVRAPSLFSKTTGSPPSMTDIQEFVVPKSIPKTLAILERSFREPKWFAILLAGDVPAKSGLYKCLITKYYGVPP